MALTDDLVAYWKLDEASGTRIDSHGTNHLTDNNTVTQAVGKIGNAGQFVRANTEYLSVADNAAISLGNIDWTISAWVYLDSKPVSTMMIVAKDSDAASSREYLVSWHPTNDRFTAVVFNSAGANKTVESGTFGSPSLSTWYFVIAWNDSVGDTINIAVNAGATDSTSTAAFTPNEAAAEFRIGARVYAANEHPWDGRIDEVGIWKRILTSDERTALYNGGAGFQYPFGESPVTRLLAGLVSYWELDETSGTRNDSVGTNHLTDNNTVGQSVGKVNNAANFIAANSESLSVADNASLSFTTQLSVSMWVRHTDVASFRNFITKYDIDGGGASVAGEWLISTHHVTPADLSVFIANSATDGTLDAVGQFLDADMVAGTWYHIVMVYDGTQTGNANRLKLWVDGVQKTLTMLNANNVPASIVSSAAPLYLGRLGGVATNFLNGDMDLVGLWNRPLTTSEVMLLYNAGVGFTFLAGNATLGQWDPLLVAKNWF